MPAVPAITTVVITSESTTSSSSNSCSSTTVVENLPGRRLEPPTLAEPRRHAFTVLKDDTSGTIGPINIIDVDEDIESFQLLHDDDEVFTNRSSAHYGKRSGNKGKRKYGQFQISRPDQQSVTSSNVHVLQKKLMDLSESTNSPQDQRLFTRTNGYLKNQQRQQRGFVKVNNLKTQKVLSKSNGHIQEPPQAKLKKDTSKSYTNLRKNNNNNNNNKNIYQSQKENTKSYHRNCHTSTSIYGYKNNMASTVKPTPVYNRDFSNISDTKPPQQNGTVGGGRRKSSPNSDQSMSPFGANTNNNNNVNAKNRLNENNNKFMNNGYTTKNGITYTRLNNQNSQNSKPLFVTTVKSGEFLNPPPELAYLLGLNQGLNASTTSSPNESSNSLESTTKERHQHQVLLYSFSSQPRVLHQHHHRAKCDAAKAAKNTNLNNVQHQRSRRDTNATLNSSGGTTGGGGGSKGSEGNEQDGPVPYGNIMFDRRVVRGSTFAQHPIPTDVESQAARQQEARRRALARRRAQGQQTRNARFRLGTPPPVAGRKHENVQTEKYLEEIFDRPPESEIGCQTDLFMERPESPFYIPAKTGLDVETQIYPGDLFDFDVEVQPIVEVLVGKTIEQALIEVLEEEELAALRAQQRRFKELRDIEKAEEHRLEEQDRRLREEKERRVAQYRQANQFQKEAEDRVAAAVLTHGYLADLLPSVLEGLKEAGYLLDDIRADVEDTFMPWLMNEVQQEMDNMVASRDILTDMVREILETRAEIYRVMGDEDASKMDLDSDEETAAPTATLSAPEMNEEEEEEATMRGQNAEEEEVEDVLDDQT